MRKIFAVILFFVMIGLYGCGSHESKENAKDPVDQQSEEETGDGTNEGDKEVDEESNEEEEVNEEEISEEPLDLTPPYDGTIFLDPHIVTENDPSTFLELNFIGKEKRIMFDRRVDNWIEEEAFLFQASFSDGFTIEFQVNQEFETEDESWYQAMRFTHSIGQLSAVLKSEIHSVTIHKGYNPFGGGNNNILIHTEQADAYIQEGILEETLIHEGTHTSIDPFHFDQNDWLDAQTLDGRFISTYAQDFPDREDLAESFLLYVAAKYRADRISQQLLDTINEIMPNRLEYFENQDFDMRPYH
ncbi:hypothetical protein [Pseudalkalibacillus sp. SCS-8]|uniref:hypothetical protein n=1 Tax=Pseudalkalibacillus nanhaiensis TaxID=3115291 RepID=UPI0032D9B578